MTREDYLRYLINVNRQRIGMYSAINQMKVRVFTIAFAVLRYSDCIGNGVTDTFAVTVTDANFTRMFGGVSGDDSVDVIDLIKVKKHIAGVATLTGSDFNSADLDKNGDVNSIDLILLSKILLGVNIE